MVNDLYTLILNLPASDCLELIDPSFSPAVLSDSQAAIRNQIFPIGSPPEYMSFVAKGIVRLCETSSLWSSFLDLDKRQPVFLNDIVAANLICSLSITIAPQFIQSVDPYISTPQTTASQNPDNNFLVSQEYIHNPGGTTTIGTYGAYAGRPESGIFSSSWKIQKKSDLVMTISSVSSGYETIEVPIISSGSGATVIASSSLPGEPQLSFRIFGPSIPTGFSCIVTASRPMEYSYQDLYSRLATTQSVDTVLSVSNQLLSQTLSSFFWSPDNLHDAIAAIMLGYAYSFKS